MKKRYLFFILLLLSLASLFIGVKEISPGDLLQFDQEEMHIFLTSRIPRLVSILISGISISICGLIMQQISQNKFVSPTTAGTMDSARLGILVSMLLFSSANLLVKISVAFLFALAGTLLFMKILEKIRLKDVIFVPLVGLMFGNIISSVATFFAYKYDLIQNMSSWLQGDFSMIMQGRYEILYISIPLMFVAYFYADKFTIAGMGKDFSKNLGLNYKQVIHIGLIIVAIITASVVLTVGMIPFLGLIIPNLVSIYYGDHLKKNLPYTALLGAIFVLFCDIVGRLVIYPFELSISLTVGIIGCAIFLYLLMRSRVYAT
ncbi:ABC transporter permease [Thermoactinomyces mirandus]|uniref:ABC transporter permease n=1 Tax=Thermoactinomyces mirandus TaxID=2756294 RepID=A0A7W1XSH0_9BACL|nr:ABC transporter permease [Thermoactinomyces mirandus]MBA4602245.1 ABC transporter permease [Thermoactinomyces mirandus]